MREILVAIPFAGDCPHRRASLDWVTARWRALGYEPVLGESSPDRWVKAEAVANALAGSDADIVVMHDSDVWCDGTMEAVERVANGAPWAIPHMKLYRLSADATTEVLAGTEPHTAMPLAELMPGVPGFPYEGQPGGGIVVLRRDVYQDCPLDPRFVGWALEDAAWNLALRCLHGPPVRLSNPLWHLWHPPQENRGVGTDESRYLHKRYARAKRRPEAMRALIAEAR